MSIDLYQLQWLNDQYTKTHSLIAPGFVCPILNRCDPGVELIDGHILNAGYRVASRRAVIQRKDLDNHYGGTIEPETIEFFNLDKPDLAHLAKLYKKSTTAVDEGGAEFEAFYPGKPTKEFAQIDLPSAAKDVLRPPHVKGVPADCDTASKFGILRMRGSVSDHVLLGTLLKSAYLALFDTMDYTVLQRRCLAGVRSALATFFLDRAGTADAEKYFGRFHGAYNEVTGPLRNQFGDSVVKRTFLMLLDRHGEVFGLSVLLGINDRMWAMTLPWWPNESNMALAYEDYLVSGRVAEVRLAQWDGAGRMLVGPPVSVI